MDFKMIQRAVALCAMSALAVVASADEPTTLAVNGGFERTIRVPGLPDTGGKHGSWLLEGSPAAPAEWVLSGYFGGKLTVQADGAAEGRHYLRISAGTERQAHIHQACPGVRTGPLYRVSMRYRGGPVEIKAYEYGADGGAPRIETVATGAATAALAGEWQTAEGEYFQPHTAVSIRIVAAVETGQVADIDDIRLTRVEEEPLRGGGWINVRDYGASGSPFETTATTTSGEKQVELNDVGDFRVGQGIMISKCHPHYINGHLRGPGSYYSGAVALDGVAELRGFDGSAGDWLVFVLDIDGDSPLSFRWSDDLARSWQAKSVPITWDWQALSGGLEVKIIKRDLELGHGVTFSARTQLVTRIEKIEGNTLWLRDAPTKTVSDAVARHCDAAALQAVLNRAVRTRRNLHVPNGYYRLEHGLIVRNADIRIEGASGVHTVMDISDGTGSAFGLYGGRDVTIRHFSMLGHTGMAEQPGTMRNATGNPFWCCALKSCNAVSIHGTERVLCEDIHVTRMASEAFYCQGASRTAPDQGPAVYTKSLTFLRCSVTDCAANAFNNNDTSENTSVLYCRIDGAGWHAYEGPGRFIKLIGNYVRNAGPFTVGDMNHRHKPLLELGCGQAIVADNVFEGCDGRNGGIMINHGSTQVTITNNLFVNYSGTAITVAGQTTRRSYPARQAVVRGNIIDLTSSVSGPQRARAGIAVSASDVTVSDNQVYVRGDLDPRVTGIRIAEPAVNVNVHDNLVRNCGHGIVAQRCRSSVTEVFEDGSFLEGTLPLEWPYGHRYRGWNLAWLGGANRDEVSSIEEFDAETCRFHLAQPLQVSVGDSFSIFPPSANWALHSNTISSCRRPVALDGYGSPTSVFRDNSVVRDGATGVQQAVAVMGQYKLIGNHIHGFDEPGCGALALYPYHGAETRPNLYHHNIFENCAQPVQERAEGLWATALKQGNVFITCPGYEQASETTGTERQAALVKAEAPRSSTLAAAKLKDAIAVDGRVDDWPWSDDARVVQLRHTPQGDELLDGGARMCAAWDGDALFLAVRVARRKGVELKAGLSWKGDGIELSFRGVDLKRTTPIFVLWGTVDGTFGASSAMGASASETQRIEKGTSYAAQVSDSEWACEWRLPFVAMGLDSPPANGFRANVGIRSLADDSWTAWIPTGGRVCEVDVAGTVQLIAGVK